MTIGECDSTAPVKIIGSRGGSTYVLNTWRRMRRAAHEALTKRVIQNYHPIQMKEATILVPLLLMPSANLRHFRRLAASTIMSIVCDYPTVLSEHDDAVEKIKVQRRMRHAVTMGSYFVDIFPLMKYIPEGYWRPFCFLSE